MEAVIGQKPEEPVFFDCSSNSKPPSISFVRGLEILRTEPSGRVWHVHGCKFVCSAEVIVTPVIVQFTVQRIGTTLGDGVDDPARRLPVFSGVIRSVDLELFYGRLRRGIADTCATPLFRKECLVVIGAVHGIVIEQCAHAPEAQQAEAA